MNNISFTPSYSRPCVSNSVCRNNSVSFTGLTKKPNKAQVKQAQTIAQRIYKLLFIPRGEAIKNVADGYVYTESFTKSGLKRMSKKYELFATKPTAVIEDNAVTKIGKKTTFNKNGTCDVEFIDRHTPDYPVAVGYSGLRSPEFSRFEEYNGGVKIAYGDKKVEVSPEQRQDILKKFSASIDKKFSDSFQNLIDSKKRTMTSYKDFTERYYKDPDVIGATILRSPHALSKQLETVSESMPYGIEAIMSHLG